MDAKCPDCEGKGTLDEGRGIFRCFVCKLQISEDDYYVRMRARVDAKAPDYMSQ